MEYRYVEVRIYRRVLPEVDSSFTRVYQVVEPSVEGAIAYGENKARKHKLTGDGWMSTCKIVDRARFDEVQNDLKECGVLT